MKPISITFHSDGDDDPIDERAIAKLSVVDQAGQPVEAKRVTLEISKEGLFELGKELIRLSHSSDALAHLHPSFPGCATSHLGLFLHPASAQLLILKGDFGTVSEMLSPPSGDSPIKI
jgi:hypothetical protein